MLARRQIPIAAIVAIVGAGIGLEIGEAGFDLAPRLGAWVTLLGSAALLVAFVTHPRASSAAEHGASASEAGWAEFRRELRRSRRNGRPLTLVRIDGQEPVEAGSAAGEDGAADLGARARRIGLHLRLVDRVWVDDGSIYLLLPESPRTAVDTLVRRIRSASASLLPETVRIATLPDDGLTSGALIAALHDSPVGSVPIPIRPTGTAELDVPAFGLEDESGVGEAAMHS